MGTTEGELPTIVRVAVADSRRFIADALGAIAEREPGFSVVASASGAIVPDAIVAAEPDLVLVGVGTDEPGTLAFIAALVPQLPLARVVLVADRASSRLIGAVLEHSLGGLLLTDSPAEDLLMSLRHIVGGHAVLPGGWQSALAPAADGPLDTLSARQLEVLRLLAQGCSYEEIGRRLFISVNTVKFHTRAIFERLGVRNRAAAAHVLAQDALARS